jgi:hypothetical protein
MREPLSQWQIETWKLSICLLPSNLLKAFHRFFVGLGGLWRIGISFQPALLLQYVTTLFGRQFGGRSSWQKQRGCHDLQFGDAGTGTELTIFAEKG